MISPEPLHTAKIIEPTIRLTIIYEITKRGANRLLVNNIIPPIRPRFSTSVQSAKYAQHEGMPNPDETPKRIEIIKACITVKLLIRAGDNDVAAPKIIHK
jgi:hypothetical protein